LKDKSGNVVSQGEISSDGADHPAKIPVPAPGLYVFTYSSPYSWSYSVPVSQPNTLSTGGQGEPAYTLAGFGGRNYFYVPKGTKQFQYIAAGLEHNIFDPNGKLARKVTESGDYVTIDVPTGMDSKTWSFTGRFSGRQFVNVPNYFAPSPQALLVPRELAEKDGLTIRK
jgi:hypothetical protein